MATGDCVISFRPTTRALTYTQLLPTTDGTLTWYKSGSSQTFDQAEAVSGILNYLQASTTQKLYVKMTVGSYMRFGTNAATSDIEIVSCFSDLQLLLPSCNSLVLPADGELKQLQLYEWEGGSTLDISSWKVKNFILSPAAFNQSNSTFKCKNNDYIESIDTTKNTYDNISIQFCKNLTEIILCRVKSGFDILSSIVDCQTKSAAIEGQLPATVTFMDYYFNTLEADTALLAKIRALQAKGWVFNIPPTQAQIDEQKDPFPQGQDYVSVGNLHTVYSSTGTAQPAISPYWTFTDAYMLSQNGAFRTVCDHSWYKYVWKKSSSIPRNSYVWVYKTSGEAQLHATYQTLYIGSVSDSKELTMVCDLALTHLTVNDKATGYSTLQLTNPGKLKSVTINQQPAGDVHTKYLLEQCANNNTVTGGTFTTVAQITDSADVANAWALVARGWNVRDANGVWVQPKSDSSSSGATVDPVLSDSASALYSDSSSSSGGGWKHE